jgi:oligoribonuclease NrnB/cAMP/cGMP phosphodiesterase (DHH superfamily)
MLDETQIEEIREHLDKSQNPLFFFDDDLDGLSSFLLLSRYLGRGKGISIKSKPELDKTYLRKITELKSDYVFILDKPLVSKEFIDGVYDMNIPLVWIDHHDTDQKYEIEPEKVFYYNTTKNPKKTSEPVTYWSYKIARKKEDMWIAMMGCISDGYLPEFIKEFEENYPDLWKKDVKSAFQGLYETGIGKIIRILNFAIKDKTSNVVKMIRFLQKVKSPYEISEERENNFMLLRFNQINKSYQKIMEKARKFTKNKVIYFQYAGDFSLSADVSNELWYNNPEKFVVVVYIRGIKANVSIRGKNARKITEEVVKEFENARGGGHEVATGATLNVEHLPEFKKKVEELVKKYN